MTAKAAIASAQPQVATPEPTADRVSSIAQIRADFPALDQTVNGRRLVYLDSAATALKPQSVIDAVTNTYARDCANVHRGVHTLSARATQSFESTRGKLQQFIGAEDADEIVFCRGTTEAVNLVAQAWARPRLGPGDRVLITGLEHHSNIVPWHMVCEQTGATLDWVPMDDSGDIPLSAFAERIDKRTKLVAVAHISNSLGTILPIADIAKLAHDHGALVLVDGAQGAPHVQVDVKTLGCDFYTISGHKMYGPTGAGALWARRAILEEMSPYQGGGDMIHTVSMSEITYADVPSKFEAGTPNIAGIIGLGAAVDYLQRLDFAAVMDHEHEVLNYASERLAEIPGLRIYGTAAQKTAVISFTMDCAHPHDIGTIVDSHGVAIRTGHHCAQPVMDRLCVPATARLSLGIYNDKDDIDVLVKGLRSVREMFA